MSSAPVVSITDELAAELEALADECGQHGTNWYEPRHMAAFPEYACDQDFVIAASPATILALLRERAEMQQQLRAAMISADNCELFRKDAERLDWMIAEQCVMQWQNGTGQPTVYSLAWRQLGEIQAEWHGSPRAAIDAAMQLEPQK